MTTLADLKIKIFTDGADKAQIVEMAKKPWMAGFTTNPSLLKKAGVTDYAAYAKDLVQAVPDRHISFEVVTDEIADMTRQAKIIATWGPNVYVKLPAQNSKGEATFDVVRALSQEGVRINLTTVFTDDQVTRAVAALKGGAPSCVSVFAGRLADIGLDPIPVTQRCVELCNAAGNMEVIWASTREAFNIVEADRIGCHIVTAPGDVLKKLAGFGRTADEIALEAVELFRQDMVAAGLTL